MLKVSLVGRLAVVAGMTAIGAPLRCGWPRSAGGAAVCAGSQHTRHSSYRKFLSPDAYTQRFGPTTAQVQAVEAYLTGAGFTQIKPSVSNDHVSGTAPVSTTNQAFTVRMRNYGVDRPQGRQTVIQSNDRDLTVPASMSSMILTITGLNSTQI